MEQTARLFSFINLDHGGISVATGVRLAGTSKERRRGLLGLPNGEEFGGLWITPCEAIHTFGMSFCIDLIFLDKSLQARGLRESIRPGRIAICLKAHSVLELPSGTIRRSGTGVGNRLALAGSESR